MNALGIDGRSLHYELRGPERDTALVFINSLGTDFRVWDRVIARLPAGLRVLRYDKRGHGLSDATPAPYRMQDHVDDLLALLGHLGLERVVPVGLSVGGLIALGLAATRPERVAAVVFSDTAHRIGTPEMWDDRMAQVREGGIEALADGTLARWFPPLFHASQAAELGLWRNMLTRTSLDGYLGTAAAIRDADYTSTARTLAVPALCLVGSEDGSTPPSVVRGLSELLPQGRLQQIDGAGHLPCVDASDEVVACLTSFLDEIGVLDR